MALMAQHSVLWFAAVACRLASELEEQNAVPAGKAAA
jgi:hypothetical protein